ncbi:MAG: tetratricopeptide repeat protein [Armatimonadia bacterium]
MGKWLKRVLIAAFVLEGVWANTTFAGLYLQADGDTKLEIGRTAQALRAYRAAAWLLPCRQRPRMRVAMCLAWLDRKDEALATLRGVVNREPGVEEYRYRLASLLLSLGKIDEAIAQCELGLQRHPGSRYLESVLARALQKRGRAAEAVKAYEREAVSLWFDRFLIDFGGTLRETGRADEAETLEKAAAVVRSQGRPSLPAP